MSGVSPGGVAENGTRSGKESVDLLFMVWNSSNLPPCLPSLAVGLVPPVSTTMKALTPQRSASQVCGTAEVSLLISIELPNIPSPTTLRPFRDARFSPRYSFGHRRRRRTIPAAGAATRSWATSWIIVRSEVRELLGRSPTGLAESSSLSLRTARSIPDALHPFC